MATFQTIAAIIGILFLIGYGLVKFVKWAWNH